jgi:transposase
LSTKIHAMVDALGNPLAFFLTAGQAHDLEGADALLPDMAAFSRSRYGQTMHPVCRDCVGLPPR